MNDTYPDHKASEVQVSTSQSSSPYEEYRWSCQPALQGRTREQTVDEAQLDELLASLKASALEEKPQHLLRFLRFQLDQRIEQHNSLQLLGLASPANKSGAADRLSSPAHVSSSRGVHTVGWEASQNEVAAEARRIVELSGGQFLRFGLDVGGSLCKLTFFEPAATSGHDSGREIEFIKRSLQYGSTGVRDASLSFAWRGGRFHFVNFETRRMHGALELLQANHLLREQQVVLATGGGAHKFSVELAESFGCHVLKGDELSCLLAGINFMLLHTDCECYYLQDPSKPLTSCEVPLDPSSRSVFPYLLVNVGSGVSILKVDDETRFQRVSGTCIGGGTFWGLCRLLTRYRSFREASQMAESGSARNVNMLVGDIYGGDYEAFRLSADTVASSFGKMGTLPADQSPRDVASDADIARGLLEMIAQNIAQLAYLCARRYGLTRILFCGNFLRGNRLSMGSIAFAIDYWSHGVMKALFLKHEGYFGSMGAFLLQDPQSWVHATDDGDAADLEQFEFF